MDLEQYLEHKRDQKNQECDKPIRKTCFTCYRPHKNCLCEHIKVIETKTKFVLLMHPKEAKKQKLGTGRMSHASLPNSQIIVSELLDKNEQFQSIIQDQNINSYLLYPSDTAIVLGDPKHIDTFKSAKQNVIFVLDATWPCAKKMMRLSQTLKSMKKVSFKTTHKSEFLIKHQPHENCLSTIESIYHTLSYLKEWNEEQGDFESLLEVFNEMIKFQIKCATDPMIPSNRGKKSTKAPSKQRVRPKTHRLFFWDVDKSKSGLQKDKM
jgi:DTW domain-containing protein YfiP